jgi:galactose-1-phosphate uridylyltransferase
VINLRSERIRVPLAMPSGERRELEVELRYDPLSGDQCRLTPRRPIVRFRAPHLVEEVPPEDGVCPLCPENLEALTPHLDPAVFPEPRMRRGEAVLFPNLFPYGRWSGVIALTYEHFVRLDRYTPSHYADGLGLALDYFRALQRAGDPGRYAAVTQNHLPSAGGTLVHPHLQVHFDEKPQNFFRRAKEDLAAHRARWGRAFFDELIEEEARRGERWLGEEGGVHLMVPFCPRGFAEFWLVAPGLRSLNHVTEGHLEVLARRVTELLGFYHTLGWNSFNLALCTVEEPGHDFPLWCRVVLRGRFGHYARSDISFHEKLLEEFAFSVSPEETAVRYRKHRAQLP